jgi:hypothetical protein
MMIEVHKSMARIEEKISHLSETSREHGAQLKKIDRKILLAEAIIIVVGGLIAIVGYIISNAIQIYVNSPHK